MTKLHVCLGYTHAMAAWFHRHKLHTTFINKLNHMYTEMKNLHVEICIPKNDFNLILVKTLK
jgi:hypothetical protein